MKYANTDFFKCTCCGECCRGDMRVYLNPEDLSLMAEYLGFCNIKQIFSEGFVIIDRDRNNAPLPRIRFRKGPVDFCPFLENRINDDGSLLGLCRLHPAFKPLVCMLAPGFRIVDLDSDDEQRGIRLPVPNCPGLTADAAGAEDGSSAVFLFPAGLERRLENEKNFFADLREMLNAEMPEEKIIEELYIR